ncbi:MAG TPA: anti-sigma factor [Actinomycetota bacterium]|nr:anti-sigma factor [Actinomycetota bacterium]
MNEHEPDAPAASGGPGASRPWAPPGQPVDHARIDELLAGHALHALDGSDQLEAERILTEHLPTCERCRGTVSQFRAITADLAFASRPKEPPEMLLPRLRMETLAVPVDQSPQTRPPAAHRMSKIGSWLSAAAAIVLIGLILWNAFLHVRLSQLTGTQSDFNKATNVISQPDTKRVTLDSFHTRAPVLFGYREEQVVLQGLDVEAPATGNVYRLWLGKDHDRFRFVHDFKPRGGVVALVLDFDARKYDRIVITEEPESARPTQPGSDVRWSATLKATPVASGSDQPAA